MSDLNLRQIQGFVLRMYRMPQVRHFLLKVNSPAAARALLGRLASGDERDAPQITTAEEWHVGDTWPPRRPQRGALKRKTRLLSQRRNYLAWAGRAGSQRSPPPLPHGTFDAFVEGAAKRAEALGDRAQAVRTRGSADSARAKIT